MQLSRRGLLLGGGALVVAPAIVKVTSLMPLRGVKLKLVESLPNDWLRKALTHFILDEHHNVVALPMAAEPSGGVPDAMHPVNLASLLRWGEFMEERGRRVVAKTKISDDAEVSTVFLGLDHSFGDGPPVLFETVVLGGEFNEMDRYETWKDAERGHAELVKRVRRAQGLLQLVQRDENDT